jgi:enoyl-CoA hydratase/carnithine racemase
MEALMNATTEKAQIRVTRSSAAYWRVTFDNPPLNVMGPQFVREFREIITAVEADEEVKVLVFESAVEGFFLNHSDFHADLKDLTSLPQGPTGLGGVAGHTRPYNANARRIDRFDPRARDRERK